MVPPWVAAIQAGATVAMGVNRACARLVFLRGDECPEPEHPDPNVVATETESGHLVFVDRTIPDVEAQQRSVIVDIHGEDAVELEAMA